MTPALHHFNVLFYSAVLEVLARVSETFESQEEAFKRFPFLEGYCDELAHGGLQGLALDEAQGRWTRDLRAWEQSERAYLPCRALLRAAGLDQPALSALFLIGLIEEEPRFGLVFEAVQNSPGQHRMTLGLLKSWWREDAGGARGCVRALRSLGLIEVLNPDAPRMEWALEVPAVLWDAMRGETSPEPASWLAYTRPEDLPEISGLILPASVRHQAHALPELLGSRSAKAAIVRGPRHNGRHTLLGAVAHALGRGLLEVRLPPKADDSRWRAAGPLATLLNAMPVIVVEPAPGEAVEIPDWLCYAGPCGIVSGKHGGLKGAGVESAIAITLDLPDPSLRRRHWERAMKTGAPHAAVSQFRFTAGDIPRAARAAAAYAALDSRHKITAADVRNGARSLHREALETLAVPVPVRGGWDSIRVPAETIEELKVLESRCRHREALNTLAGAPLTAGVRALFSGPSGTGKTLAATVLASALGMDLYRVDLSAVVNKYIGETEKNLNQVFSRAEELDVILLFDEGDSLFTQRTRVETSNDRYANLETNFLLQRVESFEGILIVTTNAADQVDTAFQRRMDVVVKFRAPEPLERRAIWDLHLPEKNQVEPATLEQIAARCTMTGGQIRNAVLHASVLALDAGLPVGDAHVRAAVEREYRKAGGVCPLRATPR